MLSETRQVNRALLAAIAVALAVGVASCGERQPQPSPDKVGKSAQPGTQSSGSSTVNRATDTAEQTIEKAGKALDDAAVTAKVKSALVTEPNLKALSINVDTTAGIVTLRGTADSAEAKQKAEQVASTVEGVRSVRNELIVVRG